MIQHLAGKADLESKAGTIVIRQQYGRDKSVLSVLSPQAARYMASLLNHLADEAEAWKPEDDG